MAEENEDDTVDTTSETVETSNDEQFETSLRNYLDSPKGKKRGIKARRLRKFLDMKPSAKRTKFLKRFKAHAATLVHQEGMSAVADVDAIDWENINWDKIFENLMNLLEFILKIIPLFV